MTYNKRHMLCLKNFIRQFLIKLEIPKIRNHLGSCIVGWIWRRIYSGFIDNAKGLQNTANKHRAVDIDLIVD